MKDVILTAMIEKVTTPDVGDGIQRCVKPKLPYGNAGDLAECCYYTHALIEKVQSGIPSLGMAGEPGETEHWYRWKVDPKDLHGFKGQWHSCNKPKWSEGLVGFSLG